MMTDITYLTARNASLDEWELSALMRALGKRYLGMIEVGAANDTTFSFVIFETETGNEVYVSAIVNDEPYSFSELNGQYKDAFEHAQRRYEEQFLVKMPDPKILKP